MAVLMMKRLALAALSTVLFASAPGAQDAHVQPVMDYIDAGVRSWIGDPLIVSTLRARNAENRHLTQETIVALDQRWRQELDSGTHPFIDGVMSNPLSLFLQQKQGAARGVITEIIVMDDKGLNVGISTVTSDYWQGDEPKWTKSFGAGPGAVFVGEIEQDDSTQISQSQASLTISDPETGQLIGAISVGINLDAL